MMRRESCTKNEREALGAQDFMESACADEVKRCVQCDRCAAMVNVLRRGSGSVAGYCSSKSDCEGTIIGFALVNAGCAHVNDSSARMSAAPAGSNRASARSPATPAQAPGVLARSPSGFGMVPETIVRKMLRG